MDDEHIRAESIWHWQEREAIVPDMRSWSTTQGDYVFVIVLETRMGKSYNGWTGYSISWRRSQSYEIEKENERYRSFEEAQQRCVTKLRELTK